MYVRVVLEVMSTRIQPGVRGKGGEGGMNIRAQTFVGMLRECNNDMAEV